MSCNPEEVAVEVSHVTKTYEIYTKPSNRLRQTLFFGRKNFYKEFNALKDVSFTVRKGQCFGIMGMNGAGKSTLLQIFAGTLAPTSGTVTTHGKIAALLELGSGFDMEFTGHENIFMNASLLGLSREEIKRKYNAIVEFADIGEAIWQPVKTYSSGMLMRLAFSVIANIDADILIIDEALAVGDIVFVQKCMRFLHHFMEEHTVILVTHDTSAIMNLCDEALWLDAGEIKGIGDPKQMVEDYLSFCYSKQQGASKIEELQDEDIPLPPSSAPETAPEPEKPRRQYRDVRQEIMNSSNHIHTYEFFEFDENAPSFGAGGALIESVEFHDEEGRPLVSTVGGEYVRLVIRCRARQDIFSPIVGFAFRNYLGENLFGDNTFLTYQGNPVSLPKGAILEAAFAFEMPRLRCGDYTLHVAIAEGTQREHVQHQWFHDALRITSNYAGEQGVLVGIPMTEISLKVEEQPEESAADAAQE